MVVLTGISNVDDEIKKSVKEHWKQTAFEFINKDEFKSKISNSKYSFLFYSSGGQSVSISLVIGGKERIDLYKVFDILAFAPLYSNNMKSVEIDKEVYRLEHMIKSINDALDLVKKHKISGSFNSIPTDIDEIRNINAKQLKNKTLLICEDVFTEGRSISKEDLTNYTYKYKVVNKDEFVKIIQERNSDYCYLIPSIHVKKHFFIFDAQSGNVLFSQINLQGFMKGKDLKNIVKAINKK